MKKVDAVQNFLNVLDVNNFVNLYQVKNAKTRESESICFLSREKAQQHLDWILKNGADGLYYIAETCVYFG